MIHTYPRYFYVLYPLVMINIDNRVRSTTPEFISGKLIGEFNRRKDNLETLQGAAKAFQANKKFTNCNFKRENKYCSYCKMKSHNRPERRHLKNQSHESTKNTNIRNKFKNNSSQ